jgi:hypothetical protein
MQKIPIQRALWAVLLLYLLGSLAFSQFRPIDGDEGYYASAARLVAEGQSPYLDFFYPQAPLLPFIYAPAYKVAGSSIVGLRAWSAILGSLALFVWGLFLRQRFPGQFKPILAGLLLLALNPHFLIWNLTIKSFALANLSVLVFLWAWEEGRASEKRRCFFVMGLALGILLGVRMLYGPWVVFVLLLLSWLTWAPRRWGGGSLHRRQMVFVGTGLVVGLLPTLILAARNFDAFVFNNFVYHALRSSPLDTGVEPLGWPTRWDIQAQVLKESFILNPSQAFLLVLAAWGFIVMIRTKNIDRPVRLLALAGGGFLVHLAASLVPYPTHAQYFTAPMVPILLPLGLFGLLHLDRKLPGPGIWVVLLLGVALSANDLLVRHPGMNMNKEWSLESLAAVTREIEDHTGPEDMVLSFWSGYTFESGRRFAPGMENHFAIGISERLTVEEKLKYHIAGKESLMLMFQQGIPELVVSGTWMNSLATGLHQEQMWMILQPIKAHYDIVSVVGEVKIAKKKPAN